MRLRSIDSENPFEGFETVSDDGAVRTMNQTRRNTGQENTVRWVCNFVFVPALHQIVMSGGKPLRVLHRAEPLGRTFGLQFGLDTGRMGVFALAGVFGIGFLFHGRGRSTAC